MILELIHQVLAQIHVCEHLRNFVDSVVSTLYLELLKHQFLSILR